MAAITYSKNLAKVFGPAGDEIVTCSFTTSGSTSGVTTNEAMGCTVARTDVGVFVITLAKVYKHVTVAMSVQASTTAQLFIITGRSLSSRTITITQVTAGGSTAVDTLAATINVIIVGRRNA